MDECRPGGGLQTTLDGRIGLEGAALSGGHPVIRGAVILMLCLLALVYPFGAVAPDLWAGQRLLYQPDVFVAFGLALTLGVGTWIGALLDWAHKDLETASGILSPSEWDDWGRSWERATRLRAESGRFVGFFESLLFFFAVLIGGSATAVIIGGWLTFKLGSKWQVWNQIVKVPTRISPAGDRAALEEGSITALALRHVWGSRLYGRFILGALANLATVALGILAAGWWQSYTWVWNRWLQVLVLIAVVGGTVFAGSRLDQFVRGRLAALEGDGARDAVHKHG